MTQKDLANKLNITQAMVSKLESGEYNPSIGFLFKISKKLDWKFELTFEENHTDGLILYNMDYEIVICNEVEDGYIGIIDFIVDLTGKIEESEAFIIHLHGLIRSKI